MGDVKLNSSGGGSVTLTPPSTASNLTVTLPSTSGTLLNTGATSFTFAGAGTISATTTLTLNGGAGSNGLVLNASNNVGIGTSSPASALHVYGIGTFDGATYFAQDFKVAGTHKGYLASANAVIGGGSANDVVLDASVGNLILATSDTARATLDSSGNLGLGVTPSASWQSTRRALQIGGSGAVWASTSGAGSLFLSNNTYFDGTNFRYINTSGASYLGQSTDGSFGFNQAASGAAGNAITFTQAMTLDASGNLVVGYTAAQGSALGTFGVSGRNANGLFIGGYSNNNMLVFDSTYDQSTAVRFVRASTLVGYIAFTSSGTVYSTSSDQRLKSNVQPSGSAIQSILDFPVDQFDWIESGKHQDFGAIAQKAINFIPEMVSVPADPDEMWGIDWSKAVPRLIKTIQELSAKNSELESRLAALEGK